MKYRSFLYPVLLQLQNTRPFYFFQSWPLKTVNSLTKPRTFHWFRPP